MGDPKYTVNIKIELFKVQRLHSLDLEQLGIYAIFNYALGLTQQKRSFYSHFGYENVVPYLNMETDTLVKKENYDRFYLDNQIDWWKRQATKRYNKLKEQNGIRTVLETWNTKTDIDIIR